MPHNRQAGNFSSSNSVCNACSEFESSILDLFNSLQEEITGSSCPPPYVSQGSEAKSCKYGGTRGWG